MATRISPAEASAVQGTAKELLTAVKGKFGMVPNALQTMAQAPALLQGYMGLGESLSKGVLAKTIREQIALLVSQVNGCEYCLSAHTLTGKLSGLAPDQIVAARRGRATDVKAQAALTLAQNILERRGQISDEQMATARRGGLNDAEIGEVVGHIAIMTLTNFFNNVARPEVDFPKVSVSL